MAVGQIGEITPSALTSVDMERKQEKEHVQNQNQQTVVETAMVQLRNLCTVTSTNVQVRSKKGFVLPLVRKCQLQSTFITLQSLARVNFSYLGIFS